MFPALFAALLAAGLAVAGPAAAALAAETAPDSAAVPADSAGAAPTAPSPGDPSAFRPAEWETLATGLPEEARLLPVIRFRYNRVDGPAPTLGAEVRNERSPRPLVHAEGTYAFSRKRFLFDAGAEVPLGDPVALRIGGSVYRRTATEDAWIVGENENTVFALLARTDYRDHYESRGLEGEIGWEPGADFALRVGARREEHRSLRTETRVSLFGKDDRFRSNPPVEAGDDGVLALRARVGPATIPMDGGTKGEVAYERAGSVIDGDFDYGRVRGTAHTRVRLSPRQQARARVLGGSTVQGSLPSQKVWHLGGIGTLRGHGYKTRHGDQFLLANAEYYILARKNLWAFAFLDWGAAWFGRENLSRQQFLLDGGIGIRIADGPAAVTAARTLQGEGPILVGVRLGGDF